MNKIFIGYDTREDIAFQVCENSILSRTKNVEIIPLKQKELIERGIYKRDIDILSTTEFTFTRFLIPYLMNYEGWVLFVDCDTLFLDDVQNLFNLVDDKYAVMCVKHNYNVENQIKMDGKLQTIYPRKNWSSVMLYNCSHPSNKSLSPELVNTKSGEFLHRFSWLDDKEIGELSREWNWLTDVYKAPVNETPKILHFTNGGPWFKDYRKCEYSAIWLNEFNKMFR